VIILTAFTVSGIRKCSLHLVPYKERRSIYFTVLVKVVLAN